MDGATCLGPQSYQVVKVGAGPRLLPPVPGFLSTAPLASRLWEDTF